MTQAQRLSCTPSADEIAADMWCAQVQTFCNIGESMFNQDDIYADLVDDDYADAMMRELGINAEQALFGEF